MIFARLKAEDKEVVEITTVSRKRTMSFDDHFLHHKRPASVATTDSATTFLLEFTAQPPRARDDRLVMLRDLHDMFASKPVRTLKMINGARDTAFQWFVEEVDGMAGGLESSSSSSSSCCGRSAALLTAAMDVLDLAQWAHADVARLRIDKVLRKLYKTAQAHAVDGPMDGGVGGSGGGGYTVSKLLQRSKELWPKYRALYKGGAGSTGGGGGDDD